MGAGCGARHNTGCDDGTPDQAAGRHTPSYPRPIVVCMREGRSGGRQATTVRPSRLDGSDDSGGVAGIEPRARAGLDDRGLRARFGVGLAGQAKADRDRLVADVGDFAGLDLPRHAARAMVDVGAQRRALIGAGRQCRGAAAARRRRPRRPAARPTAARAADC